MLPNNTFNITRDIYRPTSANIKDNILLESKSGKSPYKFKQASNTYDNQLQNNFFNYSYSNSNTKNYNDKQSVLDSVYYQFYIL